MSCQNCNKNVTGDFLCVNFGALKQDPDIENYAYISEDIKHFFTISSHSDTNETYEDVELEDKFQHQSHGQAESYFCTKKCLLAWFTKQVDVLPDPGNKDAN